MTIKVESYLWLPLLATVFNFLFALRIGNTVHTTVQAQSASPDVLKSLSSCETLTKNGECILDVSGQDVAIRETNYFTTESPQEDVFAALRGDRFLEEQIQEEDEKDPMLDRMPGLDFEAYVRADIATFYGKEPGSMVEATPRFNGQAGKFVNLSPEPMSLKWVDDGGNLTPISTQIPPFGSGGTATFPGHKFVFVSPKSPNDPLCTFRVVKGTSVYYYDPYTSPEEDKEFDPARCVPPAGTPKLHVSQLGAEEREKYRAHKYNFAFAVLYKNFTGGSEWLSMYPRSKPLHKMWRADRFGQEHHVVTQETQFHTDPGAELTEHPLSMQEMRRNEVAPLPLAEYRNPGTFNMTLKAVSCAPRAFEIDNFLSEVEVDHLVKLVNKQSFARSSTGEAGSGSVSSTRTSRNTWIPRSKDLILNSIYQRAADALRLNEALLRNRDPDELPEFPTRRAINEDLQVVHYAPGQEYTAHHDFGYPRGDHPDSPSRSINFCMYLKDVEEGGETSFPRWRNAETSDAINVKPQTGKALIFYMVNPDGNLDDLTQHAALPVIKGEKLFVNLWIHDPFRA